MKLSLDFDTDVFGEPMDLEDMDWGQWDGQGNDQEEDVDKLDHAFEV